MKWIVCALVAGLLVACASGSRPDDEWMESERLRVLSTTGMVDELVREVGGEHVARLTLIGGALDPHSYELVKGDDEKLGAANVIFYSGLGLEHGPSLRAYLHGKENAIAIGDAIVERHPEAVVRLDGQVDPHIWMDVSLWREGADVVAEALSRLDPDYAASYRVHAELYKARLDRLDTSIKMRLAGVPEEKRYVITSHDACNYFSRRYLATDEERAQGTWVERCTSPEGLAPDAQLSLIDIQRVVECLTAYNVDVLFPESNLSQDSLRKIVDAGRHQGLEIRLASEPLYADAMGEPGSDGDTYEKMMRHNARVFQEQLSG